MKNFVITTDSCSDLTKEFIDKNHVGIIPYYSRIGDMVYGDNMEVYYQEFYQRFRMGEIPSAMSNDLKEVLATFTEYLEQGLDILHIGFSSALDAEEGQLLHVAAAELKERYPLSRIVILDSKNISLGLGMLVHRAILMKRNGKRMNEIIEWVEANKANFHVVFTVNDLCHLYRSGNLLKKTAILISMLRAKPIFVIGEDGHLTHIKNVRGRKNALLALVKEMRIGIGKFGERQGTICIIHGDSTDDAKRLAVVITKRYPNAAIMLHTISPSLGTHTGPDAIGICFYSEHR